MKKLLPPQLFLLVSVLMGLVCWYFDFSHYVVFPFNLAGLPLLIGGLAVAQIAKNLFHDAETNVNTFALPDTFVTTGIYQYSRNPMYVGLCLSLLGVAVLYQGSLSSFILVIGFFLVVDRWYIKSEEATMRSVFGQSYLDYCSRTRKWI
ncbi:MAG: isoprenylcysteine carboxylmethyltransferase family protein [Gammaproteobacteria bacterium]|jgi:protein-S-isoprenylcysteine O-methyltransferase Ste14